jgi:hypothetical protein
MFLEQTLVPTSSGKKRAGRVRDILRRMSPESATDSGHFHAVKFYDTRESLCRIVAEFLGEGLVTQQPVLVFATPEHRAGILAELSARHFDVEKMQAVGDLLLLDAADTLAMFMVDGTPDGSLFIAAMTRAIEQVSRGRTKCTVRAYGEMVDVLWKNGQDVAAIRLEMLWNKLAATHQFSLLCGYAMGTFYKDSVIADIHRQHSHVVIDQGLAERAQRTTIS